MELKQREMYPGELVSVPEGETQGQSCSFLTPTRGGTALDRAGKSVLPAALCDIWTVCDICGTSGGTG